MARGDDPTFDDDLDGLPVGRALGDLEDDFFRTGESVSRADIDRAAERHDLSAVEHAELHQRAEAAGYVARDGPISGDGRTTRAPKAPIATADLDSFTLLLRDVVRYPLLDAKQEVELARAIEAGQRAADERPDDADPAVDAMIERGLSAKRRLVACNIRLVINNARSYRGQGLDLGDLVQAGTLGLIRAAEKFDWRLGFKFSTYATWWIRQSIARQLADTGRLVRLPVHIVERVNRLRREARKLEQRLGREPDMGELAEALGWDVVEITFLRDVAQDPLSLDAPLASDDAVFSDLLASTAPGTETAALASTLADDLRKSLEVLTPRQREVLVLRYGLDGQHPRTLEEIGQLHSLTRERIRQIEQSAKEKLETVLVDRGYGPE